MLEHRIMCEKKSLLILLNPISKHFYRTLANVANDAFFGVICLPLQIWSRYCFDEYNICASVTMSNTVSVISQKKTTFNSVQRAYHFSGQEVAQVVESWG